MRILLIAVDHVPHLGASFRKALEKLGHDVMVVDHRLAYTQLDRWPLRPLLTPIFKGRPSGRMFFGMSLRKACSRLRPEVLIAAGAGALDRELLQDLRSLTNAPMVLFSTDNPFNPAVSTERTIETLSLWDVVATPRKASLQDLREHCRGEVMYLPFGYDPGLHYPEPFASEREIEKYRSNIAFMGGCDRDRVPYLDPLARCEDLAVRFYGGYYRYTPALKRCHRGMAYGRAYRLALSNTCVAICLVRRANGDGHVMRTFEIPACGSFMLAERTDEHEQMFEEDVEAAFFTTPDELVDKARFYSNNGVAREKIARKGHERVTRSRNTYADRLEELLRRVA